ncbi:50S ribosomal protein L25/general stress protein Ctc [Marinobacterium sediminicola]|uniref:Large ribosomal subunit protein bL25 n=1 Tax=Marinobacterium sediminicola TaxID=518898 RepID=A0ABY1S1C0_9GAMM|nr:50S ribosomal protein L25/general stress protein Ctc [Marinobacterium sediminicola]ULG69742.1 50S ribosomal protein L25/general stress protein Ctc [Marinobacterium sediminicola]SMR75448.1 large subunit ribosomal protein L25 [Marinobacterium sediminicola]
MATFTVNAVARNDQGKGASRRLRREGLIPGIIYGSSEPKAISVIAKDLNRMLLEEGFYSSILTLNLDGQEEKVIIKDLQRHPAKPVVLHADFQRIDDNQKIKLQVPLTFVNFEKSAASKAAAKFAKEASTVEILCLPKDLPEVLEVDLSKIELGQIAHLSDITLPEGVEIVALRRGADHDQSVGYCYAPRGARAGK